MGNTCDCEQERSMAVQMGAGNSASSSPSQGHWEHFSQKEMVFIVGLTVAATLLLQVMWHKIWKKVHTYKTRNLGEIPTDIRVSRNTII